MSPAHPTRVRWILVAWVTLVAAVSYLDRVNISIAGHSVSESGCWAHSADLGGCSIGSFSGFMSMRGQIGGAVTAALTPALAKHYGWTAPFLAAAGLCALGAAAWLVVETNKSLVPPGISNAGAELALPGADVGPQPFDPAKTRSVETLSREHEAIARRRTLPSLLKRRVMIDRPPVHATAPTGPVAEACRDNSGKVVSGTAVADSS
jgi:hypothetical protein